jgi:hypothetical protein
MHNFRFFNPLDYITKQLKKVSAKRSKTDVDYEKLARIEHRGGTYSDSELSPYLSGQNSERCLLDAARIEPRRATGRSGY